MSDYEEIIQNVSDLKKFFKDMLRFFIDLNKKIQNVQLEYFFLERLLIFSIYARGYNLFLLCLFFSYVYLLVIVFICC